MGLFNFLILLMKISIVTVSYNSSLTITRTIESVLSQKNIDLEYIIVDGASKDGTVDIIRQYAEKKSCIKWISEKDNGIYDAMNKGIGLATGEVIGILNSDDYYAGDTVLEEIVKKFCDDNTLESCYGNLLYVKNKKPYRYWKSGEPRSFINGWMPPHPAFFVRKKVYEKYGVFRLDCGTAADYELMLRFLEKYKITTAWLDNIITFMTAGGASNSGFTSRINAHKNDEMAWDINKLERNMFTLYLKKIRKIPQFVKARFIRTVY